MSFEDSEANLYLLEDTVGDYKLQVKYEYPNFIVEVIHLPSNEVMARPVVANFEPRFGIDVVDMDNIMAVAEELCIQHENNPLKDVE